MYILYWYIVFVTVVSVISEIYKLTTPNIALTQTEKLGAVIGLVLRQATVCAFLVLVYPALSFV